MGHEDLELSRPERNGSALGERDDDSIVFLLRRLVERIGTEYGLTPREKQVLEGAALGKQTKEVASHLLCSPKTIEEYWRRIYKRFNLASRQEIVAKVLWESLAVGQVVANAKQ